MTAILNSEVRATAARSVLCWLATADGCGQPNVSPKGFKVIGAAVDVTPSEAEFSRWVEPLRIMVGNRFPIHSVFVVRATAVEPIIAPSYRLYPLETTEELQVQSALRTYGVNREGGDV